MTKNTLVLAALSSSGGHRYTPVQVQKLMFMVDRELSGLIGAPRFKFRPYDYGPFDKQVYFELDKLARKGFVRIDTESSRVRTFSLTQDGRKAGEAALGKFSGPAQDYIRRASDFVTKNSFSRLVAAIYKAYPEMRVNSVFQS